MTEKGEETQYEETKLSRKQLLPPVYYVKLSQQAVINIFTVK